MKQTGLKPQAAGSTHNLWCLKTKANIELKWKEILEKYETNSKNTLKLKKEQGINI